MKHLLYNITTLLVISFFFISCEKEKIVELNVDSTQLEVVSPGISFKVTSNEDWSITQSGNYSFNVTPTKGSAGETEVRVKYTPNETEYTRTSTITITAGDKSHNINLFQDKVKFSLSTKSIQFTADGGSKTVTVKSNIDWSIQTSTLPTWIKSISPMSGSDNTTIDVTIVANKSESNKDQTHTLVFRYGNSKTESLVINQEKGNLPYYEDGEYVKYIASTKANPIVLIFTGDGYIEDDHIKGGAFDQDMEYAINAFFEVEPYNSYREYFTVYKLAAYSNERGLSNTQTGVTKDTKFQMTWAGGTSTHISSPNDGKAVLDWCKKIPGIDDNSFSKISIGVVINADQYAGTCLNWRSGKHIAMMAFKRGSPVSSMTNFGNTVRHEMGGHGFGRLADEYVNEQTTIPEDQVTKLLDWQNYGNYMNVSAYSSIDQTHWSHFNGLSGYSHVGMYEGAKYYAKGIWRPEKNSCMIDNRPYYNSPSRFYIVRRILELAGEITPIDKSDTPTVRASKIQAAMERFLPKDTKKTESAVMSSNAYSGWDGVPYDFRPLASPVEIED